MCRREVRLPILVKEKDGGTSLEEGVSSRETGETTTDDDDLRVHDDKKKWR